MVEPDVSISRTVTDFKPERWNAVVEQANLGTVFHTHEWLAAVESGLGLDGRHIVVTDGDSILGVFPHFVKNIPLAPFRRLVSVNPGYGGPIVLDRESAVLDAMRSAVADACTGRIVAHRVNAFDIDQLRYARWFADHGYVPQIHHCRVVVPLSSSEDQFFAKLSDRRRAVYDRLDELDIREASRTGADGFIVRRHTDGVSSESDTRGLEGLDVRRTESGTVESSALDTFHDLYSENMRRIGADPHPREFFTELADRFEENCRLFFTHEDDRPTAGLVCLTDQTDGTFYPYFIGSTSDGDVDDHTPIYLWTMAWARDRGFNRYDMGGTPADFRSGLFSFKREFGGEVMPIVSWERGYAPIRWNAYRLGRWAYRIWN